jgi:hypothetical protein
LPHFSSRAGDARRLGIVLAELFGTARAWNFIVGLPKALPPGRRIRFAIRRSVLMNVGVVTVPRSIDAHRALTRTDLLLCALPIAVFLSIVSLV